MQLPAGEALVLVSGTPPLRAAKVRSYANARFRRRLGTPPPPVAEGAGPPVASPWAGRRAKPPEAGADPPGGRAGAVGERWDGPGLEGIL
jgi:type IV secretion system protein VirD4